MFYDTIFSDSEEVNFFVFVFYTKLLLSYSRLIFIFIFSTLIPMAYLSSILFFFFLKFLLAYSWFTMLFKVKSERVSHSVVSNSLQPMDCSPPGSSVHGHFQGRILEWVAIPFSRRSFQPRDQTQVSCIAGGFFITWATREASLTMLLVSSI